MSAENDIERPDPDELLRRVNFEAEREQRGKLKIFFGACAGVGKTYAMLRNARALSKQGVDIVAGVVETHGRPETEKLLEDLHLLPRKQVAYRDCLFDEFDVDAALDRRPAVLLVDELAHTNAPGSRHPKRWQDVEELLIAGIDVHTTLNVQHIESLNDVIGVITGIRVRETVPDRIFDAAAEIVLVDLPADDLLLRLKEGKVYLPDQAERAIQNFFRKGNLIALRELSMRRTADRIDDDVRTYRTETSTGKVWQTRERLLACVGPAPGSNQVLRSASRLASALNAEWHTVYVETPALQHLPVEERALILERLKLAQDLGAVTASISGEDVAHALVAYARKYNVTKIVLGRTIHQRYSLNRQSDLPQKIVELAPEIDMVLVGRDSETPRPGAPRKRAPSPEERHPAGNATMRYGAAIALCAAITAICFPFQHGLDLTNIAMIFLAGVLPIAFFFGRNPAVFASIINTVAFDVFFVPPHFSLTVSNAKYLITFAVMLGAGILTANLTARLRFQVRVAKRREERVHDLYRLARELSGALNNDQIVEIVKRAIATLFDADSLMLLPDVTDRLRAPETGGLPVDIGIAQWCMDHNTPAGMGTDTLPGNPMHYLPLKAPMRVRGVLALLLPSLGVLLAPERRQQLEVLGALAAIALERIHFVTVAQDTLLKIESERLRESLLAALSHDLRTPLTVLAGMAESLLVQNDLLTPEHRETVEAIFSQTQNMSHLVTNLLEMARLESGQTLLRPDWQNLEELVGAARNELGARLAKHNVAVEIPPEFPLLHADAVLLERVLVNLLENAAKYVPEGKRIGIRAHANGDTAAIAVWDDGPGIPEGREKAIFEKFMRGDPESPIAGVGLGLAITRAIVEAHGGAISATNRPEGGAQFVVQWPLKPVPELEPEPEPEPMP